MNDDAINPYASPRAENDNEPVVADSVEWQTVMCHVIEDDLLAWATHFVDRSGLFRKARRRLALLMFTMILLVLLLFGVVFNAWLSAVIMSSPLIMITAITLLILPRSQRRSIVNNTKQIYREGKSNNVLGDIRYTVTPTEFRQETRYGHSSYYWQGLEGVEEGEDHLFVLTTSGSACVIPLRDFLDERHRAEFTSACQRFFEQAQDRELPLPPWA